MITIDGGRKSGSGTIVRDTLSYSVITGESVRLMNIRAGRDKPGLRPQHMKAIQAVAQLNQGHLEGDSVGSSEIIYHPGTVIRGGEYRWNIGTAGSTTMLLCTVLPLALFAGDDSRYVITGGLFQDYAPPAYHIQHVLAPQLRKMGAETEIRVLRPGYFPKGGGGLEVETKPVTRPLHPLHLSSQGEVKRISGIALSSRLQDRKVSDRMAAACRNQLQSGGYDADIEVLYDTEAAPVYNQVAPQPGAALAVWCETKNACRLGADMAGAPGRPAERIGQHVALTLQEDLHSGGTTDRFLADQLVPFVALASGTSDYVVPMMTDHIDTRLWLAEKMLEIRKEWSGNRLRVTGLGFQEMENMT